MNLVEYLLDLKRLIASRQDVRLLSWTDRLLRDGTYLTVRARVQFTDDSFIELSEAAVSLRREAVSKLHYSYHYQRGNQTVFRYDNAPHFPGLPNYPHHKHIGDQVEGCAPPDLARALKEIDSILYPASK